MAPIIFLSLSLCCLKQSQFQTNKENNKLEKKHTIFSNWQLRQIKKKIEKKTIHYSDDIQKGEKSTTDLIKTKDVKGYFVEKIK